MSENTTPAASNGSGSRERRNKTDRDVKAEGVFTTKEAAIAAAPDNREDYSLFSMTLTEGLPAGTYFTWAKYGIKWVPNNLVDSLLVKTGKLLITFVEGFKAKSVKAATVNVEAIKQQAEKDAAAKLLSSDEHRAKVLETVSLDDQLKILAAKLGMTVDQLKATLPGSKPAEPAPAGTTAKPDAGKDTKPKSGGKGHAA